MGTGGEERRWKGTPRLAPLSPHPGASPPSPLYLGSSFSVYAAPTNQSARPHPRPQEWARPRASRDERGLDSLGAGWGMGSIWRPRLCWGEQVRRPQGLTTEFGLYLVDGGEPLGAMEQRMPHLSLLLSPFSFCTLVLSGHFVLFCFFSFSVSPKTINPSLQFNPFCLIPAHPHPTYS